MIRLFWAKQIILLVLIRLRWKVLNGYSKSESYYYRGISRFSSMIWIIIIYLVHFMCTTWLNCMVGKNPILSVYNTLTDSIVRIELYHHDLVRFICKETDILVLIFTLYFNVICIDVTSHKLHLPSLSLFAYVKLHNLRNKSKSLRQLY